MVKLTVDKGTLTKYSGDVTELVIPDGVVEIASPKSWGDKGVFEGHTELTSIILPDGLQRIGESAFENCSGLKTINIPDSVKIIGKNAFRGCKEIEKIVIPNKVKIIEDNTFSGCKKLVNVHLSEKTEEIGRSAFSECSELTNITIPKSVLKIQSCAFDDCISLKSITIPDSPMVLDSWVFRDCTELTTVTIPDCVKYYSDTFKGCKKVKINGNDFSIHDSDLFNYAGTSPEVIIPEGVETIRDEAFANHTEIISITIPDSVKGIEERTFEKCSQLREINLPDSIEEIDSWLFDGCSSLASVRIPESVKEIGYGAFSGCSSLSSINLTQNIKEIKSDAFNGCSSLLSLEIPNTIKTIEYSTFRDCIGLKEITIPESIVEIKSGAFVGCSNLKEILIPKSIVILDCSCFPKEIKRIIIDPDTKFDTVTNANALVDREYEINPLHNIPISVIAEPDNKIKLFFEYCKEPDKYPKQIAEGYEKYGRSQRSRILREAEAKNNTEVISYYEKKGKKASERTYSAEEKAEFLKKAIQNGSDEDLQQILQRHKTFTNESSMLKKAISEGMLSKTRILLEHGAEITQDYDYYNYLNVESDCFIRLLESKIIATETKIEICKLCFYFDKLSDWRIGICLAACIFNFDEIIEIWKKEDINSKHLILRQNTSKTRLFYRFFKQLSKEECLQALDRIFVLTDPVKKSYFELSATDAKNLYRPDSIAFIISHFKLDFNYCGEIFVNTVKNNHPKSLLLLSDYWKDVSPKNKSLQSGYLTEIFSDATNHGSKEMLELLLANGWIDSSVFKKNDNFTGVWKAEIFNNSVLSGNPDLLKFILRIDWVSILPSSFSKINSLRNAVISNNPEMLSILESLGWIRTASQRDSLIDFAINEKKSDALAWLLEYKNKTADPIKEEKAKEQKERRSLVTDTEKVVVQEKQEWKTSKNGDGTYAIERYLGKDTTITVPAQIGKKIVTTIRKDAFNPEKYSRNSDFPTSATVVIISEGIKSIEEESFVNFTNLISVVIPESVEIIGNDAFKTKKSSYSNDNEKKLIIYGKTNSFAQKYADQNDIHFVSNENSEKLIPDFAIAKGSLVAYNGKEKNIIIPEGVIRIGPSVFKGKFTSAFQSKSEIESVVIPNGVTEIGKDAFKDCEKLSNIILPDSLQTIGDYAFSDCRSIKTIIIPDSVGTIGVGAFSGCWSLESVILPANITKIAGYTFSFCENLTDIRIPDTVTVIGASAFSNCENLENLTIPSGITTIGEDAFEGAKNLQINGDVFYIKNYSLIIYTGKESKVIVPSNVKEIGHDVFASHREITEVILPDGLLRIGYSAFRHCSKLKSIELPDSLRQIGNDAFAYCNELTKISIPQGVTSLGSSVFVDCKSLTSITIPESVTSFGFDAFRGCLKTKLSFNVYDNSAAKEFAVREKWKYSIIEKEKTDDNASNRNSSIVDKLLQIKFDLIDPDYSVYEGYYDETLNELVIIFETKGTLYNGRTKNIEEVKIGDPIQIIRDPQNKHNSNNFYLVTKNNKDVGNMPAEICDSLAPLYDNSEIIFTNAIASRVIPLSQRGPKDRKGILFVELHCAPNTPDKQDDALRKKINSKEISENKNSDIVIEASGTVLHVKESHENSEQITDVVSSPQITPSENKKQIGNSISNDNEKQSQSDISDKTHGESFSPLLISSVLESMQNLGNQKIEQDVIDESPTRDDTKQTAESNPSEQKPAVVKREITDQKLSKAIEKAFEKLEKLYPEHKVFALDNIDKKLRADITELFHRAGYQSDKEMLAAYDFEFISGDEVKKIRSHVIYTPGNEPEIIKPKIESMLRRLNEAYSNHVIPDTLTKNHKNLSGTVSGLYQWLGYSDAVTMLKAYGYTYTPASGGRDAKNNYEDIINSLIAKYRTSEKPENMVALLRENPDMKGPLKTLQNNQYEILGMTLGVYLKKVGVIASDLDPSQFPERVVLKNSEDGNRVIQNDVDNSDSSMNSHSIPLSDSGNHDEKSVQIDDDMAIEQINAKNGSFEDHLNAEIVSSENVYEYRETEKLDQQEEDNQGIIPTDEFKDEESAESDDILVIEESVTTSGKDETSKPDDTELMQVSEDDSYAEQSSTKENNESDTQVLSDFSEDNFNHPSELSKSESLTRQPLSVENKPNQIDQKTAWMQYQAYEVVSSGRASAYFFFDLRNEMTLGNNNWQSEEFLYFYMRYFPGMPVEQLWQLRTQAIPWLNEQNTCNSQFQIIMQDTFDHRYVMIASAWLERAKKYYEPTARTQFVFNACRTFFYPYELQEVWNRLCYESIS